ncbi:methyltransferase domain-containing protein [Sporosarcina sp. FSL K6-2383]|uniref:class I SAM-dependent methyltransferase n=1 Tax=Sporosarcina sp. FSL K6-2383 TaxID=2921556 RepID=UPI003159A4E7
MTKNNQDNLTRKINRLENAERKNNFPAEDVLKLISIKRADNILDLGAGTGYLTLPAAKQTDGVVYALDLDGDILNYLDSKAQLEKLTNVKTLEASFAHIPLEDNTTEIALASISLHEVNPLSDALKEINRVMTKNGTFLCVEFEKKEASSGPRVHSSVMEQELRNAGFDIIEKIFPAIKVANEDLYMIIAQKQG